MELEKDQNNGGYLVQQMKHRVGLNEAVVGFKMGPSCAANGWASMKL